MAGFNSGFDSGFDAAFGSSKGPGNYTVLGPGGYSRPPYGDFGGKAEVAGGILAQMIQYGLYTSTEGDSV